MPETADQSSTPRTTTKSLAATFRPFAEHVPPMPPLSDKARRAYLQNRPRDEACIWLSSRGAMEPEGCTKRALERAVKWFGVSRQEVLEICSALWEARLLGWHQTHIRELSYAQVRRIADERIPGNDCGDLYRSRF